MGGNQGHYQNSLEDTQYAYHHQGSIIRCDSTSKLVGKVKKYERCKRCNTRRCEYCDELQYCWCVLITDEELANLSKYVEYPFLSYVDRNYIITVPTEFGTHVYSFPYKSTEYFSCNSRYLFSPNGKNDDTIKGHLDIHCLISGPLLEQCGRTYTLGAIHSSIYRGLEVTRLHEMNESCDSIMQASPISDDHYMDLHYHLPYEIDYESLHIYMILRKHFSLTTSLLTQIVYKIENKKFPDHIYDECVKYLKHIGYCNPYYYY